ncbi:MAG: cation diffusion facilitator family transporter [Bradyrhizobium sp.]|nr:cation diffusion facilitator family transporter [Bradyrhizobium sp.]
MANAFFTDLITTISERGRTLLRGGSAPVDKHDATSLAELCEALVSGAGEASGTAMARDVLDGYHDLDAEGRKAFFTALVHDFGPDKTRLAKAIEDWRAAPSDEGASALHFASDVLGSVAVIAGLVLTALGFWWGDSAAAIAVALMISVLGLRLARSTVETLLDRAPDGAAEKARAAIRSVAGVVDVERLRVRLVGATHFVDATVQVPRTYPIDRVHDIKRDAQAAVDASLAGADVTFTTVPVALSNESVRERIMVIARNSGLAIHHVTVHDVGGRLIVAIDLEVDGDMTLVAAHAIAHELERSIREEFGADVEVDTHIEPLEPELPFGVDSPPEFVAQIAAALQRFAAETDMYDVHNVRVRNTEAGEIVNFHCRAAPSMSVLKVHDNVDHIERGLRRAFPSVKRVISHAEPPHG